MPPPPPLPPASPPRRLAAAAAAALAALIVLPLLVSFQTGPPPAAGAADALSLDYQHLLATPRSSGAAGAGGGGTPAAPPPQWHAGPPPLRPGDENRIPRRLIFTYKHNILATQRPRKAYANVMATIHAYQAAWNATGSPAPPGVWFLDDNACRDAIAQVEPRLVPHFDAETTGGFKADICRAAAMTLRGGYYFDVDVEVVRPYVVPDGVTFCAPTSQANPETFFQAFMAVKPNHPVMVKSLEFMLRHYNSTDDMYCYLLGPKCLYMAYANLTGHPETPDARHYKFLYEFRLKHEFPEISRQTGGGMYCNYGVQDLASNAFHFYSRFVGSSSSCSRRKCDEYGCSPVVFDNDDLPQRGKAALTTTRST